MSSAMGEVYKWWVTEICGWDQYPCMWPRRWSYFEILSILKEMGYVNVKETWYSVGGGSVLEGRLKLLSDDKGACHMVNIAILWEMTSACDVLPPTKRVLPSRPKKKWRMESWELKKDNTQLRQGGTRKKCGLCREVGHKRTNCPHAPPAPQESAPSGTQQNTPPG